MGRASAHWPRRRRSHIAVALRMRNACPRFEGAIRSGVQLTPAQFEARYSPTMQTAQAVERYLCKCRLRERRDRDEQAVRHRRRDRGASRSGVRHASRRVPRQRRDDVRQLDGGSGSELARERRAVGARSQQRREDVGRSRAQDRVDTPELAAGGRPAGTADGCDDHDHRHDDRGRAPRRRRAEDGDVHRDAGDLRTEQRSGAGAR